MTDVLLLVLARPSRLRHNFTAARTNFYTQHHTAPRDPSAHSIDQITGVHVIVMRFQGTVVSVPWYKLVPASTWFARVCRSVTGTSESCSMFTLQILLVGRYDLAVPVL